MDIDTRNRSAVCGRAVAESRAAANRPRSAGTGESQRGTRQSQPALARYWPIAGRYQTIYPVCGTRQSGMAPLD
eukprot:3665487-Rhodomonas_salina.2